MRLDYGPLIGLTGLYKIYNKYIRTPRFMGPTQWPVIPTLKTIVPTYRRLGREIVGFRGRHVLDWYVEEAP